MECLFSVVSKIVCVCVCVCVCERERERDWECVCLFIQGVSTSWAISGGSSPDQNKEKSLHEYTSANTFQKSAQQHVGSFSLCYQPQSFGFLSVRDTQKLLSIKVQLLMKRHLTIAFFMPVKLFATIPGRSKECDSPWSDVSMHVLIRWKTFWALVMNCDLLNNTDLALTKFWMCTVHVLCHV